MSASVSSLPTLAILGTGWASYSVLKHINKRLFRVVVVSPRNHFLFTPLLCSTTVGTLEFRSIIEPVRNTGFRHANDFFEASAEHWSMNDRTLTCQSAVDPKRAPFTVAYDKLVIGVGSLPNAFGVPGVLEHAFFLKEVSDARRIRSRLLINFERCLQPDVTVDERRRLLHTVIVGGGPTGVEFGAELYDFLEEDVVRLYPELRAMVNVTLVESRRILDSFDARLRTFAEKKLASRQNFTMLHSSVTKVEADAVVLDGTTRVPCGLVVWSTGLAPRPFVAKMDNLQRNRAGQITTDEFLRVRSDPSGDSYALGDCADIDSQPLPCTAQGRYVAECLNASAHGHRQTVKPFQFKSMGMLAYIGGYSALTDTPELKLKGFTSWLLWRSAYLTRLGSWRLRLQVPLDWTKTLLFGRDTSRF